MQRLVSLVLLIVAVVLFVGLAFTVFHGDAVTKAEWLAFAFGFGALAVDHL